MVLWNQLKFFERMIPYMKDLCAIYCRVSTDKQVDHGLSLPAQQSRLVAYCQAHGWEVYQIYVDDGYSGKNLDRPAMKRMLADAKDGKFSRISVIKLDRLSRSQKDALYLIEDIFNPRNIGFHSVSESFDTTTPFGKASLGMMSVFAQLEREMIIERILITKKESAKQGRFMGGYVPYGYTYDRNTKKLLIDPTTAPTVHFIYASYLLGQHGFQSIANMLNDKKIPTPNNSVNGWDKSNIRKMIITPYYVGKIPHLGKAYPSTHEPIVTQEQYDAAQDMIKNKYTPRPVKEDDNLLSGLIYCGECGARMRYKTIKRKGPSDKYYLCYTAHGRKDMSKADNCTNGYKHVELINQAVESYVLKVALNPALCDEVIKQVLSEENNPYDENEMIGLKLELVKIQKKLDRWYDAFEDGGIDSTQLSERIQALRIKQTDIQSRLSVIEISLSSTNEKRVSTKNMKELLGNLPAIWEDSTPAEQRFLLPNVVDRIDVYRDGRVKVKLAF